LGRVGKKHLLVEMTDPIEKFELAACGGQIFLESRHSTPFKSRAGRLPPRGVVR
jgi:hypothetical protein